MFKLLAVVNAHHQRADRLARRRGRHVAGDDEFLPVRAFRLDPALAAAGSIRRVAQLGDDTFQAQPAGVIENELPVFFEMSAVADRCRAIGDQLLQHGLALDQGQILQVVAVEMEEVENVEDETIRPLCR